jgi:hypothetical protein
MASMITIEGWREEERHEKQRRLRELARWYRDFAERAGNPVIWEARLRTAKELEQEADRLEKESAPPRETGPGRPTRREENRLID